MSPKTLIIAGALVAMLPQAAVVAQNPTSGPAVAAAQPAATPGEEELRSLVQKIQAKMRSGVRTEEALAPELKEFDALYEKCRATKSLVAGDVAAMRAMLYFEVFRDEAKGEAMLVAAQKDFPDSERLKSALRFIEQRKAGAKAQGALAVGALFPGFEAKDLNGAPLSIAQFKGKVVLVDFWATWCGPCVGELPNVLAAYEKYHAKGFEIVGISLDQSEDKLKAFISEKKMTWPQYFDGKGWENEVSTKYGINSIPATFLLDREGKIVAKGLRGDALEKELARLFGN